MRTENDYIVSGPEFKEPLPECSLAEYILPKMKLHPRNNIAQVDSETGVSQTFGELLKLSFGISEGLLNIGSKVGDTVALVSKNRSESFAAALGVIWSGGVLAPINPGMAVYELKHFFGLIQPKFIICEISEVENVEKALSQLGITSRIIVIDSNEENRTPHLALKKLIIEVDVENFRPQPIESPSTELVLLISSSGTTGLPKEVGLTHQNMIFQLMTCEFEGNQMLSEACIQYTVMSWITGILLLLVSAVTGAKRIFVKTPTEDNILKAIHTYKPIWMIMSPGIMTAVMKYPNFKKYDVSSIKFILLGGNAVSEHLIHRIKEEWNKDVVALQAYGQTELSGGVTEVDPTASILSVGKLRPGVQLKVMDLQMKKTLGPNQVGELCFKSKGMMKCYIGNPEETNQTIDTEGWCHSGDIGYYDDKQHVFIVDRIKEMIITPSLLHVSPAELEGLIETIPGVLEAGVAGIPIGEDCCEPMALVVKRKGFNVAESDIIGLVKDTLSAEKQLQGGVAFIDSIPRTMSGKIKRTLLKELAMSLYNKNKM